MCAALRQEPHFENHPTSIRKALANSKGKCARRSGESRILRTTRLRSTKLLQYVKTIERGAKARASF
eukprot:9471105-Pyramimonas_sp.AAC.2